MLAALKARFNGADDFCLRELTAGGQVLYALFLDGMTSGSDISDFVVRPLMENLRPGTPEELYAQAQRGAVWCAVCEEADSAEAAADKLTHGYCVVVFPGLAKALCFEAKSGMRRGPSAPESENTVKGAKDAFTETIRINTALVRRHLRTPELRLASKTVGRRTQTNVTVCSIAGLTDPKLVARMEKRLSRIDIDGLLSPAAVEEYVTGSRRTAFPLLQYTERTDQFCQGLLEGQVGLLVDGLPLGYLAPVDLVADHSEAVLYALMFFVGISVGGSRGLLGKLRQYHVRVLIIPAGIVAGSVLGGLVCAPLAGMSLPTGAAVASGLGWYSLAGVMMTDIAGAQVGSITFLANLLRELVSFFSIPWIAKHLNYPTCIAPAGATSEDTTLPMLIRCTNGETVVLSVLNGVICSALVPVLIEAFHQFM